MVLTLMSGCWAHCSQVNKKTILIDGPEAFLYPALARTLSKQIATHAKERHVFVATHSAEFVMGAVEAGTQVRIVRLQYQSGIGRACLLENADLRKFMNNPLLRSAHVMSGLFAKAVAVTEADNDRAFYQEINTRLLAAKDPRGIENCVFMNAQNKQTISRIVSLLRRMGVPAAGIVDLDVVAEGGTNWGNQIEAIAIPKPIRPSHETTRANIFKLLQDVSTDKEKL